jgi:hypothetical protein
MTGRKKDGRISGSGKSASSTFQGQKPNPTLPQENERRWIERERKRFLQKTGKLPPIPGAMRT